MYIGWCMSAGVATRAISIPSMNQAMVSFSQSSP